MSSKLRRPRLHIALVVVIAAAAVFATTAFAAKPSAYSPTLGIDFATTAFASTASGSIPYATPYLVSGCGYDRNYGAVTIVVHSPEAISWAGQLPDANGCISLSNFSTQGAGHYQIDAYQQLRKKSSIVASTSFDLN
jgi:hypothetical protein